MTTTTARLQRATADETELVRRAAAGDLEAFEQIMRRYNRILFRTARSILHDDADAEDAVQETYLRAHGALRTFRGDAKLSTWLVRIAANEALERRRGDARRARILPMQGAGDPETDLENAMHEGDGPEALARRSEMRRLIERKIDALPEAFRTVFVLRAVEELNVEETAAALQLAPATVRSRFFRARSLMREALSRETDLALEDAFAFAGARCDRIVAKVMTRLAAHRVGPS